MPDRRALVVFAHPDDVDFGAGGAIAHWVDEGWDVRYLSINRGQKGAWDAHMDAAEYRSLREVEQSVDGKLKAWHAHASKIGDGDTNTLVGRGLRDAGRGFGLRYAETFRVIGYRR